MCFNFSNLPRKYLSSKVLSNLECPSINKLFDLYLQIRMGKEMAAMARQEEETRLRRIVEERQREKEEEERAREAIKKKLGEFVFPA